MKRIAYVCLLLALVPWSLTGGSLTGVARADEPAPKSTDEASAAQDVSEAASSTTRHSVTIDGRSVAYRATAGYLIVNNAEEKPAAKFGYTAYVKEGVENLARRPLLFAFNGGPGSASIWLHLGALGPRRVEVADAEFTPPPFELVENEHSILDVADLVMIDPVGTGFSRPVGEATGEDFWGVDQDADSVSRFIKAYIDEYGRWSSPKILLGESYGGMRAGGVTLELLNTHNIALNGVVLVSPFMNWTSGSDGIGIDLPHVLYLPTLAATAWYHGALENAPDTVAELVEEAKTFAFDVYAPALLKGSRLGDDERRRVLAGLARFTGVGEDYWDRADLRVAHGQYVKELLRRHGKTVGRIDSRYLGRSFNLLGEEMNYDPMFAAIGPAFTAAFLDYYHNDLDFGRGMDYRVSGGVWREWDWSHEQPDLPRMKLPHPNTTVDLAYALGMNPHMKILVQQGYYDLATPQVVSEYDIEHMDVPAEQRENIRFAYYESGHMMYLHPPSLLKFKKDLADFIADAVP